MAEEAQAAESSIEDDDNLTIDMSGVTEYSRELVPAGNYNCIISDCEYSRSKNANKPMWTLMLEVVDGDHQGRKFWTHVSFSEKALPGSKATIKAIKPELLDAPLNPKKIAEEGILVGLNIVAKVGFDTYQSEKVNRVKSITAAGSGGGASGNEFMAG